MAQSNKKESRGGQAGKGEQGGNSRHNQGAAPEGRRSGGRAESQRKGARGRGGKEGAARSGGEGRRPGQVARGEGERRAAGKSSRQGTHKERPRERGAWKGKRDRTVDAGRHRWAGSHRQEEDAREARGRRPAKPYGCEHGKQREGNGEGKEGKQGGEAGAAGRGSSKRNGRTKGKGYRKLTAPGGKREAREKPGERRDQGERRPEAPRKARKGQAEAGGQEEGGGLLCIRCVGCGAVGRGDIGICAGL